MKPVKNNDTINMHNDDLPPLPRKTAWSIIRDAMVQAARIERGGYSNEERSARFDAVAAQAEKAIQALPAVAASGSPPSPTRHQVVLLGAHSGRSIAGALIPATATTLYVRQDEVLALFDRASSGSTGAPTIAAEIAAHDLPRFDFQQTWMQDGHKYDAQMCDDMEGEFVRYEDVLALLDRTPACWQLMGHGKPLDNTFRTLERGQHHVDELNTNRMTKGGNYSLRPLYSGPLAQPTPPEFDQVRHNYEKDTTYRPYCLRCSGLVRMVLVEPYFWRCKCGAEHDIRVPAPLAQPTPAASLSPSRQPETPK